MLSGTFPPTRGLDQVRGPRAVGPRAAHASSTAASAGPSRSRGRSGACRSSRTWRWPATSARTATAAPRPRTRPSGRSPWSACRPTATRCVDGLGAAGLKKLELAKALATGPKLLLADESLGGLDETEMDQAADMLRKIRDELGITIIWVEHIMGVLMRVVDRVMVLDHGEKISEGLPQPGGARPARDRGLSRHRRACDAGCRGGGAATGADAGAQRHRRGLRQLPGAVRRRASRSRRARRSA